MKTIPYNMDTFPSEIIGNIVFDYDLKYYEIIGTFSNDGVVLRDCNNKCILRTMNQLNELFMTPNGEKVGISEGE